jgi:hypothetical protein
MNSNERYFAEYMPVWKRIDNPNAIKGMKMLFKETNGPAVIGVWYDGCNWEWYCGLPKHAPGDKDVAKT